MIPSDWLPHRRQRDDELVGYLVPQGVEVVPVTLFGYPLAGAADVETGRRLLESTGLSVLAEPWRLELEEGESIRVKIREVSPDRVVVVTDDFGYGGNLDDSWVLSVPETGRRLSR
jgi:hypothetical protein